ncbi:MAG: Asparagine synthetase [Myxococcales bacterium]|nr:Asparagine synthetase [Myxococcales bacterium]
MAAICGIFGDLGAQDGATRQLVRMLSSLEPRCSQEPVIGTSLANRALLGMRARVRLTSVFTSDDDRWIGVADGDVFNYREVAAYLRSKGVARKYDPEHSASCELLLHLYALEGAAGLKRVDAQYALAFVDRENQQLHLARDFLGVRAIYFACSREGVVFGSEIKSVLQHSSVAATFDPQATSQYLTFLSVPCPRTLFEGISKLPPGCRAVIEPNGAHQVTRYWDLLDDPIAEREDEQFYIDNVRSLHSAAVDRRMVDGPIAALLSGGNDSSANAALIAQRATGPLHTFTVGLRDVEGQAAYTDIEYARKVAAHIGSKHHERLLEVDEFLEAIPVTVNAMDDMVSEPSSVFLHHALRLVKEQGITVVVTGEANDEISCGHGEMIRLRDKYYKRWARYMKLPHVVRRAAAWASPFVAPAHEDMLRRAARNGGYFWSYEIAWWDREKQNVLSKDARLLVAGQSEIGAVEHHLRRLEASEHAGRDYLSTIVYLMMMDHYFGNLMLGKLDLLAGQLGLEPRCPYTEHRYSHFVYNIPARFKAKGDLVKYFFKRSIEGLLPDEIIYRPKQGFRTPVIELFKGRLGDWARPALFEGGLTRSGFLDRASLEKLFHEHRAGVADWSNRLWTVMALNLWHDRWTGTRRTTQHHERSPYIVSSATLPVG